MLSDNASTYVAAAKELEQLFSLHKPELKGYQVAVHPQESPMVWGLLGKTHWINQVYNEEGIRQIICHVGSPTNISSGN